MVWALLDIDMMKVRNKKKVFIGHGLMVQTSYEIRLRTILFY
ncbi:hypothetical protein JCM19298_2854 [Nonlabens ulvanivorans]|nr:hypothetical protein JCM19298_2854 [Nonlabens ulvanivorans]